MKNTSLDIENKASIRNKNILLHGLKLDSCVDLNCIDEDKNNMNVENSNQENESYLIKDKKTRGIVIAIFDFSPFLLIL